MTKIDVGDLCEINDLYFKNGGRREKHERECYSEEDLARNGVKEGELVIVIKNYGHFLEAAFPGRNYRTLLFTQLELNKK